MAIEYMNQLGNEAFTLSKIKLNDKKVLDFINDLLPIPEKATVTQINNIKSLRNDFKNRYFEAPDLKMLGGL